MSDKKELLKQAKEIEDFLNEARNQINKECPNAMPYKAKVIFIDKKGNDICP